LLVDKQSGRLKEESVLSERPSLWVIEKALIFVVDVTKGAAGECLQTCFIDTH